MTHLHFGLAVERDAASWLLSQGVGRRRVIARNYRCRMGEIDLVLEEKLPDGALELVFVEVRYRSKGAWISGAESVGWKKRMRLRRAIRRFLLEYDGDAESVRVDVVARDGESWEHLKNIRMDERGGRWN